MDSKYGTFTKPAPELKIRPWWLRWAVYWWIMFGGEYTDKDGQRWTMYY